MKVGDLTEKIILVTGASSGIGRTICVKCAEAGARVVLLARNVERLKETMNMCPGDSHSLYSVDLTDLDVIPKLVRSISKEVGHLNGLVHSAGLHQLKPLRSLRAKDMQELFNINAAAGVMLVKGFSAKGCHEKPASVVLLSSVMGHVGQPGAIAYCMSKGAVNSAVQATALELAAEEIRVNSIAPAMIETEMTNRTLSMLGEKQSGKIRRKHPCGFGKPEDVANAAIYLLSDSSRYINGTSLIVDGGYTAQ